MNIIEAYIKFNKELIILISGLSGSGKTQLAKNIERDFKIEMINAEKHCVKNYNNKVKLNNGVDVIDWDAIDAYDWDTINKLINEKKSKGVVVCGQSFPTNVLKEDKYFHIHIKIQKQLLIETRKKYVKENLLTCKDLEGLESAIVNQITYPHYLDYLTKSRIDKFINSKGVDIDSIYDETAKFLFFKIEQYLNKYNEKLIGTNDSSSHRLSSSSSIKSDEEIFIGTQIVDTY